MTHRSRLLSLVFAALAIPASANPQDQKQARAYAFGLIDQWAALGSKLPRLANLATNPPGLSNLLKRVLHLSPQRSMPRLATLNLVT